jgi:hypothetical protein
MGYLKKNLFEKKIERVGLDRYATLLHSNDFSPKYLGKPQPSAFKNSHYGNLNPINKKPAKSTSKAQPNDNKYLKIKNILIEADYAKWGKRGDLKLKEKFKKNNHLSRDRYSIWDILFELGYIISLGKNFDQIANPYIRKNYLLVGKYLEGLKHQYFKQGVKYYTAHKENLESSTILKYAKIEEISDEVDTKEVKNADKLKKKNDSDGDVAEGFMKIIK